MSSTRANLQFTRLDVHSHPWQLIRHREQSNAAVKSDGGAVGLTQSPEALRRWLGAGPEVVRLINSRIWSIH